MITNDIVATITIAIIFVTLIVLAFVLLNEWCKWEQAKEKAPALPSPAPKPSVSAEEFLAQAKAQAAEKQPTVKPKQPEAPKKSSNKLFSVLALCATFALGGVAGSAATSRYELSKIDGSFGSYRIDRLTGKVSIVARDHVRPLEEK